jgi:hypothetical protein
MAYHIMGFVPNGIYMLTHGGKSERVKVQMNKIIWNPEQEA